MERSEFAIEINRTAAAFDKSLKPAMLDEYYSVFADLEQRDFVDLMRWAKTELEKFPPIAMLIGRARAQGYFHGLPAREMQNGVAVVECKCGGSFAVFVKDLLHDDKMFKCPERDCTWSYDAAVIKAKLRDGIATFGGIYAQLYKDKEQP